MIKNNISVEFSEELIKVEDVRKPSASLLPPLKSSASNLAYFQNSVDLVEDNFGVFYDDNGFAHNIRRFTWRNKNKITVQVINFGARITSIKMPDRKGNVDDIVLGFDDIAGYIYNKNRYFGATIGRMTNVVRNSTFHINNKQFWLTPNQEPHHYNGGGIGLDQIVWTTFVDEKRVIMSHVSPHMSEGYPGDVLIRIVFELSARNEFSIRMEAQCTQPTILNLSNLTYFNLGGHHSGSGEIYKHVLTLNCNCFTPKSDGITTGQILNVIHTEFDFQIPKLLGKAMGIIPKDGYNQNLCVNRGMNQDDCFVARLLHTSSGRLLELYSNQPGIQFSTANDFGYDSVLSTDQIMSSKLVNGDSKKSDVLKKCEGPEALLKLYEKIHQQVKDCLIQDEQNTFQEIYNLIKILKEYNSANAPNDTPEQSTDVSNEQFRKKNQELLQHNFSFTQMQSDYLNNILTVLCDSCDEDECAELKEIVKLILQLAKVLEEEKPNRMKSVDSKISEKMTEQILSKLAPRKSLGNEDNANKTKKKPVKKNQIPDYYRNTNKIIGKNRAHYTMHGGVALQTQNYPGCANIKNFPNCILKPGETYTHTITYKFWIRSGNPTKWIKKNMSDTKNSMKRT